MFAKKVPFVHFGYIQQAQISTSPDSAMDCEGMRPFATPLPTTTLSTYPSSTIGAEPEEAFPSPSQSLLQTKTIPSIDCEEDGRIASSLCKPKRCVFLQCFVLSLVNVHCSDQSRKATTKPVEQASWSASSVARGRAR